MRFTQPRARRERLLRIMCVKSEKAPVLAEVEGTAMTGAKTDARSVHADSTARGTAGEPKPHKGHSRNGWENVSPEIIAQAKNARALRWWRDAEARLRECPEAKKLMWGMADEEVANKRRFSFARIAKDVADKRIATSTGEDFKLNHNHIAAYARMYLLDNPGARRYMNRTRDSMFNFISRAKADK